MPKPYDALFKDLLERDPAGWVRLVFGDVSGPISVVDADISTVSGAADKVLIMDGPDASVIHFEGFAAWDETILPRAMFYNGAHHRRHFPLPVETVMVILGPEADHWTLTGVYQFVSPLSKRRHKLEYTVLRTWQLDLEAVLHGSLATLPLAPLTDGASGRLREVLGRMQDRFEAEATPEQQKDLWADTFVLMGLRHPLQTVTQLFRGVPGMKESVTYRMILEEGSEQGIERGVEQGLEKGLEQGLEKGLEQGLEQGLEKGRLQEAVRALFLVGTPRLGPPDASTRARIEGETSFQQVEEWLPRVAQIESWSELS